jgi:hypothetical protein
MYYQCNYCRLIIIIITITTTAIAWLSRYLKDAFSTVYDSSNGIAIPNYELGRTQNEAIADCFKAMYLNSETEKDHEQFQRGKTVFGPKFEPQPLRMGSSVTSQAGFVINYKDFFILLLYEDSAINVNLNIVDCSSI